MLRPLRMSVRQQKALGPALLTTDLSLSLWTLRDQKSGLDSSRAWVKRHHQNSSFSCDLDKNKMFPLPRVRVAQLRLSSRREKWSSSHWTISTWKNVMRKPSGLITKTSPKLCKPEATSTWMMVWSPSRSRKLVGYFNFYFCLPTVPHRREQVS